MDDVIAFRRYVVFWDKKWEKFISRARPFHYIPFVEFAMGAGSLVYGNVRPQSDFDVIVGVRQGRIFTARLFCYLVFGALGWRRRKLDHKEDEADKICLNHYVTPAAYCLSPPYNEYWQHLYENLVPVYGDVKKINMFLEANADWVGKKRVYHDDLRHTYRAPAKLVQFFEYLLSGSFGNSVEALMRVIQIRKIERSLNTDSPGYEPRIIYTDNELEFHPDTRRIRILLAKQ